MKRRALGSGGGNNDGILHRPRTGQFVYKLNNGSALLPYCDVNAKHVAVFLIYNGIYRYLRFSGLTVAYDKFTLTSAYRDHAVDRLDTCLQGHGNAFSFDYSGRFRLNWTCFRSLYGTFSVNGFAERVYNSAEHSFADGNGKNSACSFDLRAFANIVFVCKHGNGHGLVFEVLRHTDASVLKFEQFVCHAVSYAVNAGNAVSDADNGSCFGHLGSGAICFYLFFYYAAYFFGVRTHFSITSFICLSFVSTLPSIRISSMRTTRPPMTFLSVSYSATTP